MRRRPITRRYQPPKLPSASQSEPAPSGGRPPLRCRKPTYPELERAIALLDQEMEKEGPIEDLYSIFQRKLIEKTGYAERLAASDKSHADLAAEMFLRVLARRPRPEELKAAVDFLATEPDRAEACRSLLWSLLATNEFLFNH